MSSKTMRRTALIILFLSGCDSAPPRQPRAQTAPVVRGTPAAPKQLSIPDKPAPQSKQADEVEDRTSLIPLPPPRPEAAPAAPATDGKVDPNIELTKATQKEMSNGSAPGADVQSAVGVSRTPSESDDSLATLKRIYQTAHAAYTKMDVYECRLSRRETINGRPGPQEVIAYKFRQQPFSVRLKWLGAEGQGREVVYVHGQYGGKMHIMPAKQDSLLPPMRMAFFPDDPMVRSKTRHDIREAGFGETLRQLGNVLESASKKADERKRIRSLGLVTRPEYPNKMEAIEETISPKAEVLFPQGGKRVYFFDTGANSVSKGLPVIVAAYDAATQKEVEYYCFDNFLYPIKLNDSDFDPDVVFKKR